jgi:hypothetical protein
MKLSFSDAELVQYRDNEDIVKQTARQIIKDFALFGLPIEFPSDLKFAYLELYIQLEEQIRELLHQNSTKILSLLYQIDIPEMIIQQKASENPDMSLSEVVTELIFQRELKKVLTRIYFKKQGL